MAELFLITGGSRSGKSAHAQRLAESLPGPRAYLATCPVIDAETAARVKLHREARSASRWETIEEPLDLAGAVSRAAAYRVLLVDCLTLWVSNLQYEAERRGERFTEESAAGCCRSLIEACEAFSGTVVFVTNEVGMGIVPGNAAARLFRDCAGRINQMIAAAAVEVTLVVSGVPLRLKGKNADRPARNGR
ncbi:MAG: bifunctional adenosylcobinamide kinase/adenosylcobinamide-phosphate guanylyltransferase [Syntrophales bacterium]